jgi:hypothetical protein
VVIIVVVVVIDILEEKYFAIVLIMSGSTSPKRLRAMRAYMLVMPDGSADS